MSFLGALWKFIRNLFMKKAVGVDKAANRMFTGSTEGIDAAFRIEIEQKSREYKNLESAVAEVENVVEMKRLELVRLNTEEQEVLKKREGALNLADKAEKDGATDELAKHHAAFNRFQTRVGEIEVRQKALAGQIREYEDSMKKYMLQLTNMQSYTKSLPGKKAEAMADFVSAKQIIELNHRLAGIRTSLTEGPLQAVLAENQRLTAQARVTEKLAGTDVAVQDAEYSLVGENDSADTVFNKMLSARRAQNALRAGQQTVVEPPKQKDSSRPEI